jgi:hypothetical protein
MRNESFEGMTIIFFTRTLPSPLTDELSAHGHQVFDALAISEVLALAEQYPLAQIIISADVDLERAKVIQQHYPTVHLNADATVKDILWELGQEKGASVQ